MKLFRELQIDWCIGPSVEKEKININDLTTNTEKTKIIDLKPKTNRKRKKRSLFDIVQSKNGRASDTNHST